MKYIQDIIIIYLLIMLSGCAHLYEGFKIMRTEECYRLPYPDQEECLRQVEPGYDEYKRHREEARRRQ